MESRAVDLPFGGRLHFVEWFESDEAVVSEADAMASVAQPDRR